MAPAVGQRAYQEKRLHASVACKKSRRDGRGEVAEGRVVLGYVTRPTSRIHPISKISMVTSLAAGLKKQ